MREFECQFRNWQGTLHTIVLSAEIIEINREPHILGFGIEVTERKLAETELLRTLAREKELGRLRSHFLLAAIRSRLARALQQAVPEFKPNFDSAKPLEAVLGLTPRVAETLLWLAQGKTNSEIATILGNSESTVKKHVLFEKLGVETRTAASLRALEVLSSPAARG